MAWYCALTHSLLCWHASSVMGLQPLGWLSCSSVMKLLWFTSYVIIYLLIHYAVLTFLSHIHLLCWMSVICAQLYSLITPQIWDIWYSFLISCFHPLLQPLFFPSNSLHVFLAARKCPWLTAGPHITRYCYQSNFYCCRPNLCISSIVVLRPHWAWWQGWSLILQECRCTPETDHLFIVLRYITL